MASSTKEEYEMQLYGCTQFSIISAVKEIIDETLKEVLNSVCDKLSAKYKRESVQDFKIAMLRAHRASVERHSPQLEKIVEECFAIDPAILLPEDEIQDNLFDENFERKLDKKIEGAKKKYLALCVMENKLLELVGTIFNKDALIRELHALKTVVNDLDANYTSMMETVEEKITPTLINGLASALERLST